MNKKQQQNYDLQERLIESAVSCAGCRRILAQFKTFLPFLPFITPCSIFDIQFGCGRKAALGNS